MGKILFCDDDHWLRDIVAQYLRWYGFDVLAVDQSKDVLCHWTEAPFDLLVCNAWQKELNGFGLIEQIRGSDAPVLQNLPILLVAPEPLDQDDYQYLRRKRIYFMRKYRGPESWYEKIMSIFNQRS